MTELRPRTYRRRRSPLPRILAALIAAAGIFALGLAVGQALHDNPKPEGTQTIVRTLRPLPLPPATMTVTVTRTQR